MKRPHGIAPALIILAGIFFLIAGVASAVSPTQSATPQPTPAVEAATEEQLARARAEWARSAHADTFDRGMGANTTCARCKSPKNWDPLSLAAEASHDCAACKRTPGALRPELTGGVSVPQKEWRDVNCEVCHQPIGDSYSTAIFLWDQATHRYEPVSTATGLCAHCHEGQHGFEVIAEQTASAAHQGWECTTCHGAHGLPSRCVDCHDPASGAGANDHARHPAVNCTACHDAGRLSVWQDPDSQSRHYGTYMTRRFAHTLTSWPSHNLVKDVNCKRCHHPLTPQSASVVPYVGCNVCHPDGASSFWCIYFERDADPNGTP
jgi:hypothetical protein